MSLRVKQALVIGILIVSTVWPAAHFFVVRRLNLNPWNWFGWAMYTQPAKRLVVRAYSPEGTSVSSQLGTVTQAQRDAIMRAYRPWSLRHLELGEFDDPDEFARAILGVFRNWASVRVVVQRFALDPESACIGLDTEREYTYTRAGVGL